jgi:hypothetical protein
VNVKSVRGRLMRIRDLLRRRGRGGKSVGQSLVEFTVLLPVLLIMLSGLIELGFMLNYYLDLIDAAREAARWAAGDDPIHCDPGDVVCQAASLGPPLYYIDPNGNFYGRVVGITIQSLDLSSDGRIVLDCATDAIIISAFGVDNGVVAQRFPSVDLNGNVGYWNSCANAFAPSFTTADINARLLGAPDSGLVLVEIYYSYDMILGLPWITAFVPNPVLLHAYSIMSNVNVEPTPTP